MYIIPFSRLKNAGIKREKSGKRKQLFGLLKKSRNKAGIKKGSEPESPNPEPRTRKPEVPIYHNS